MQNSLRIVLVTGTLLVGTLAVFKFFDERSEPLARPGGNNGQEGTGTDESVQAAPSNIVVVVPAQSANTEISAAESGDVVTRIPIPPEFDQIPEGSKYWHRGTWQRLHGALEREQIDPAWSFAAESSIAAAINAQQDIVRYGSPTITCRERTCQIQLIAYGANDVDEAEWHKRFGVALRELWSDFELGGFSVSRPQDSGTPMVLHLSRKLSPVRDERDQRQTP